MAFEDAPHRDLTMVVTMHQFSEGSPFLCKWLNPVTRQQISTYAA